MVYTVRSLPRLKGRGEVVKARNQMFSSPSVTNTDCGNLIFKSFGIGYKKNFFVKDIIYKKME